MRIVVIVSPPSAITSAKRRKPSIAGTKDDGLEDSEGFLGGEKGGCGASAVRLVGVEAQDAGFVGGFYGGEVVGWGDEEGGEVVGVVAFEVGEEGGVGFAHFV